MSIEAKFTLRGVFLERHGPAHARGEQHSNLKLCFASTSVPWMAELLYELSEREDCWFVKLDREVGPHGMVRGRCFLTTRDAVLLIWRTYKNTDRFLCSVQDDDDTAPYR